MQNSPWHSASCLYSVAESSLFSCPSCIDLIICEWEGVSASYNRTLLVDALTIGTDE